MNIQFCNVGLKLFVPILVYLCYEIWGRRYKKNRKNKKQCTMERLDFIYIHECQWGEIHETKKKKNNRDNALSRNSYTHIECRLHEFN